MRVAVVFLLALWAWSATAQQGWTSIVANLRAAEPAVRDALLDNNVEELRSQSRSLLRLSMEARDLPAPESKIVGRVACVNALAVLITVAQNGRPTSESERNEFLRWVDHWVVHMDKCEEEFLGAAQPRSLHR